MSRRKLTILLRNAIREHMALARHEEDAIIAAFLCKLARHR